MVYKPVGTQCYTIQVTVFCLVRPCSCNRGYQLPQTRIRSHFLKLICCGPEKGSPPMFLFFIVFQSLFMTEILWILNGLLCIFTLVATVSIGLEWDLMPCHLPRVFLTTPLHNSPHMYPIHVDPARWQQKAPPKHSYQNRTTQYHNPQIHNLIQITVKKKLLPYKVKQITEIMISTDEYG